MYAPDVIRRMLAEGQTLRVLRLSGRCANGAERDGGVLYHAVPSASSFALCGRTYGRQSAGWSSDPGDSVSCRRCRRLMERAGVR